MDILISAQTSSTGPVDYSLEFADASFLVL